MAQASRWASSWAQISPCRQEFTLQTEAVSAGVVGRFDHVQVRPCGRWPMMAPGGGVGSLRAPC
eukprot:5817900-Prymnesium_polylepis.1